MWDKGSNKEYCFSGGHRKILSKPLPYQLLRKYFAKHCYLQKYPCNNNHNKIVVWVPPVSLRLTHSQASRLYQLTQINPMKHNFRRLLSRNLHQRTQWVDWQYWHLPNSCEGCNWGDWAEETLNTRMLLLSVPRSQLWGRPPNVALLQCKNLPQPWDHYLLCTH